MARQKSTVGDTPAAPTTIEVRGARVHNLANIDLDDLPFVSSMSKSLAVLFGSAMIVTSPP